ncbi:MAG: 4Fe-4S binding protein [Candidatus Margulisbacteria bacterium]|nr:4Fe-4S binding protein [Candidatus Margulisiibacteriota bacterium]
MAYKIDSSECTSCGACETECPESAIHEGDGVYTIDPALCTDCGVCAGVCPANAISAPIEAAAEEES